MSFDANSIMALTMASSAVGGATRAYGAYTGGQNIAAGAQSAAADTAAGDIFTAKANADALQYQAAVARNNQTVAEGNARYAEQSGAVGEQRQRQVTAQTIGAQRAAMAASGIDIGSGTPSRIQQSTAATGELDAQTIRNNASRAAYNYRVQAGDFAATAGLEDTQAENAITAGNMRAGSAIRAGDITARSAIQAGDIGALSSIVGGASSVADKWLAWREPVEPNKRSAALALADSGSTDGFTGLRL